MSLQPFHPGEVAVQQRLGVAQKMVSVGARVIRNHMPEEHKSFFQSMRMMFIGASDAQGAVWASALSGPEGFVRTPDSRTLRMQACLAKGDALGAQISAGSRVGLLGMALENRRRNRVNGTVAWRTQDAIEVRVDQSFGNCPKYIQTRSWSPNPNFDPQPSSKTFVKLSKAQQNWIQRAHTFYIASRFDDGEDLANRGVDVSHRGGKPGFVRIDHGAGLTFPDFSGNFMFNTLGNLQSDNRCGLLFIDDALGSMLQLTGTAKVTWDGPDVEAFSGAQRLVHFQLIAGRQIDRALPYVWQTDEFSPFIESTATWRSA